MNIFTRLKAWATPKRLFLWIFVYPGIPPIIATLGLLAYANWPTDVSQINLPNISENTTHVTIVTHGKDDTATTWANDMASAFALHETHLGNSQALTIDWSGYSNNIFRCSLNGRRIGKHLGQQLARFQNIQSVHVIGHSAGAFLTYGLCEALKKVKPDFIVQTTYLDPLGPYGVAFWNFGPDNFGSCADFSDAYINVGDGVPGSDVAIKSTHTFDVSNARLVAGYEKNPHVWPIEFYLTQVKKGQQHNYTKTDSLNRDFPAGKITAL